ncbi:MAG TPA: hypothetical protein PK455_04905 [Caldisericia bacterium]|nr:hypothetical protein [Caldisericia bacterium]
MPSWKDLSRNVKLVIVSNKPKLDYDKWEEWQKKANGYRLKLIYQGRSYIFDFWQGTGIIHEPDVSGVLKCLLSDSSVPEDFEEFCKEFGYSIDSRKAEQTHKACLKVRSNMKKLLGPDFEMFLYADVLTSEEQEITRKWANAQSIVK